MKKNYNFNYIFLMYDVEEKRCNKVFKVCKKYLKHYQKSVFRGEISPSNILALKRELQNIIDETYDYVAMIKFFSQNSFVEEQIGKNDDFFDSLMI